MRSVQPDDPRRQRILAVVDSIPRGHVATYGQVADEAGLPGRARLVGKLLGDLATGSDLPWHRVVSAPGRIGQRPGGGPREQARRLRAEGVPVTGGRLALRRFRWTPDQD